MFTNYVVANYELKQQSYKPSNKNNELKEAKNHHRVEGCVGLSLRATPFTDTYAYDLLVINM